MYERSFYLQIISPSGIVYEGEASSISASGVLGGFQVLYNHAPLLSALSAGSLKVKEPDGRDILFAAGEGFLEVRRNRVTVLVESAERPDQIDLERARSARERAELRLRSLDAQIDTGRAERARARALNRIRLAKRK
jgi:F-type H+-transporting ATPase subunit epsilon